MTYPRYTSLVNDLPSTVPFVGPESQERERKLLFDARLGANENMFGPSPKALAALKKYSNEQWMYGDPTSFDLRCALAEKHKISTDNIVVGEGIDGLLGYLVRLIISEGDEVVTSDGAYPTFNYHVNGFGGNLHKVPYLADCEDIVSLIKKARTVDAKLIYFANPDNPMGTHVPGDKIVEALKELPLGCLLILDEAYSEFAPASSLPSPSPSNLYLDKGSDTKKDIIKSLKKGFLVTELMGSSINISNGDYSRGASGFWIENGEIAYPVSEVTIAGNLLDIFQNLLPCTDLEFNYSTNAPSCLVNNLTVAGV